MIAGTVVDQITKVLAHACLGDQPVTVIPYVFALVYNENPGGLFGMMPGAGAILAVLSVVAFGFIVWLLYSKSSEKWPPVGLGMLGAGAIGNFIDRAFNGGHVRDFILLHIDSYFEWPAFNVADALIVFGCAVIVYASFAKGREAEEPGAAAGRAKHRH